MFASMGGSWIHKISYLHVGVAWHALSRELTSYIYPLCTELFWENMISILMGYHGMGYGIDSFIKKNSTTTKFINI